MDAFTNEELEQIQKVISLAISLNEESAKMDHLKNIQTNLVAEMNQQDRKGLSFGFTVLDLYCQKKWDVLNHLIGEVKRPLTSEEISWFSELEKKTIRHKMNQKDKVLPRKLYISDMHFYHNSLNKQMDCRGFHDYEEMNQHMIEAWNAKVNPKDEVYILGDLSIAKGIATNNILKQLNGKLYMIVGNHDAFLTDGLFDQSRFVWIKHYAEVHDHHRTVVLSHYPIFCYNGQYRRKEDLGAYVYMLYGHVHNTRDECLINSFMEQTQKTKFQSKYDDEPQPIPCQMINCFCMFSDYQPLTLDEWIEVDRKRREQLKTEI